MSKLTGICIPDEVLYSDPQIQALILSKFQGILFGGARQGFKFYMEHLDKLTKSMSLNGWYCNNDNQLRAYIDEPISTPTPDNDLSKTMPLYPGTIIGESNPNNFEHLTKTYPSCQITYTSYSAFLCRIWGINIPIPFSNQARTWSKLDHEYGTRFKIAWINLTLNAKDLKELILWASLHNKEVWIYVEFGTTKEQIIKTLESL